MKGLLRKEFYILGGIKTPIGIAAMFTAALILNWDFLYFTTALVIVFLPITLFNADTKARWWTYSKTLPYSRKQIVDAKYLTLLICMSIPVLGQLLHTGVNLLMQRESMPVLSAPYLLFLLCYIPAFWFPALFWKKRHGVKWLAVIVICVILIAAMLPLLTMLPTFAIFESAARNEDVQTTFFFFGKEYTLNNALPFFRRVKLLLPFAGVLLYALSWQISRRIYRRRSRTQESR